jgi:hypothetical protein
MGSTPVTGSNLKALRDAPLSFLDFLYKSALTAWEWVIVTLQKYEAAYL